MGKKQTEEQKTYFLFKRKKEQGYEYLYARFASPIGINYIVFWNNLKSDSPVVFQLDKASEEDCLCMKNKIFYFNEKNEFRDYIPCEYIFFILNEKNVVQFIKYSDYYNAPIFYRVIRLTSEKVIGRLGWNKFDSSDFDLNQCLNSETGNTWNRIVIFNGLTPGSWFKILEGIENLIRNKLKEINQSEY